MPLYEEKALLSQIADGDETAFRQLFDRFRQQVFGFAFAHLRSEVLADEITQDVFMKVWTAREQMPGILHFEAWLQTVTRNQTYSFLRKIKTERDMLSGYANLAGTGAIDATAEKVAYGEVQRLLHEALAGMTDQQRAIYRMSREENMKYADIARKLGISEHTVNYHLKKILSRLRTVLENHPYIWVIGVFPVDL